MIRVCTLAALGLALFVGREPLVASPLNAIAPFTGAPPAQGVDIDPENKRPAVAKKEQLRGNPLWAVPLSSLTATRERPIFSPSRRPPAPAVLPAVVQAPAPPPPPAKPEKPQLTLVGTVAKDSNGIAVFIDKSTRAFVRLRMGEGYTGWTLHSIDGRAVTLQKGKLSETLSLPKPEDRSSVPSYQVDGPPGMIDPTLMGIPPPTPPE